MKEKARKKDNSQKNKKSNNYVISSFVFKGNSINFCYSFYQELIVKNEFFRIISYFTT